MHEFILTFFYSGKAKKAPGTFGSLASIVFWILISYIFFAQNIDIFWQNIFWTVFLFSAFIYGVIFSSTYAKQFGEIDHGSIVLDEVVGQIIALQMSFVLFYQNYFGSLKLISSHIILSFILFRYFDIKKPLVIGYCDRKFKNGFGVMFDDFISGIIAGALTIMVLMPIFSSN
jgi:phosphatidylglycerophosphatase A